MGLKLTRGSFAHPATSLRYHTGSWRMERPVTPLAEMMPDIRPRDSYPEQ